MKNLSSLSLLLVPLLCSLITICSFAQTNLWQQTNGPYGGRITDIILDSTKTIFASTMGSGVFCSTNQGSSWKQVTTGLTDRGILSLALNPDGDILAGTFGGKIYRSKNKAETWTELNSRFIDIPVSNIVVTDSGLIFAGGMYEACISGCPQGRLYYSHDIGKTWVELNLPRYSLAAFTANSDSLIIVATDTGLYRTTDFGKNWQHVGLNGLYFYDLQLGHDRTLFAGTHKGIYRSTDQGVSWSYIGPEQGYVESISIRTGGIIEATVFTVSSRSKIYRSTNNGTTWHQLSTHSSIIHVIAAESDIVLYIGGDKGLYRSDDHGISWRRIGVPATWVTTLGTNSRGEVFSGVFGDGIFKSTDLGNEWIQVNTDLLWPENSPMIFDKLDNIYLIASYALFRSTDDGRTWTRISPGNTSPRSLTINSKDEIYVGTWFTDGVYRSTNRGESWTYLGLDHVVFSLATKSDTQIFAGTWGQGIFWTTDYGQSWVQSNDGLTNLVVYALAIHPSGVILAGTHQGLFRSFNNASTWSQTGPPLLINTIAISPQGTTYIGTYDGVYQSNDVGESWTMINDGLTTQSVLFLAFDSSSTIYAGTRDGSVFRRFHSTTAVILQFDMLNGWNMLSIPIVLQDYRWRLLFPTAISRSFGYKGFYVQEETLKFGRGYWLKFPSPTNIQLLGTTLVLDTIEVVEKWNMVGSISTPVPVSTIASIPPGLVVSQFYDYTSDSGYVVTDTIKPGKGYWVKVSQEGKLILSASPSNSAANLINIVPTAELPPAPPGEPEDRLMKVPTEFVLDQNYPNPFNPKTNIRFEVPVSGFVSLKVFDVLGREAATLVNEKKAPGEYTVTWDGSDKPSGIYIYRLQTEKFIAVKKMLLIR